MDRPDSSSPALPPGNQPGVAGSTNAPKKAAETLFKKPDTLAFAKNQTYRALPRLGLAELAEQDRTLENELLLLLSNLDYYRSQLANPQTRLRPATALKIVTDMVDLVTGLTEQQGPPTDPQALTQALAKAGSLYSSAQEFSKELNSSGSKGFLSLFGRRSREEQHPEMLRQIAMSLVEVLESYFTLFKGRFRSSAPAEVWSQAYSLFLHDLAQVIERLYS